jgi:hypothetical protein
MLVANIYGPDLFIVFVVLAIWIGQAVAAGAIANSKGRGWGYFWAGLFLGIVGIIWAALLTPNPERVSPSRTAPGPGWWLASDGRWYPPQATPHYPPPPRDRLDHPQWPEGDPPSPR